METKINYVNSSSLEIKLSFVKGLLELVLKEIKEQNIFSVKREITDSVYLNYSNNVREVLKLGTISRAYLVTQDRRYNPLYLSKHKSVLSELIKIVLSDSNYRFKSFKIRTQL